MTELEKRARFAWLNAESLRLRGEMDQEIAIQTAEREQLQALSKSIDAGVERMKALGSRVATLAEETRELGKELTGLVDEEEEPDAPE